MKDVFLIYEGCCFYEIVTLCYFMRFSGCELVFCSPEGRPVQAMEGFTVQADLPLQALNPAEVRSLILPGGRISAVNTEEVRALLRELKEKNTLIAGICAGVDVLDDAGLLEHIRSTHSEDADLVVDGNILTARANAHVDFAIKAAEILGLFSGEDDFKETIAFWKHHQRMQ